jgi:cystathionine beta-lyase
LRADLPGLLESAGFQSDSPLGESETATALDAVERAMRNPPVDLDGVEVSAWRSSRGEKWTTFPEDVLPAWVADMDFPIAEPIRRVLRTAVDRSDLGYPVHPAPTGIPEIAADRLERRFGWRPEPKNVEILTDVMQGMFVALQQFSEPGDAVVVQSPIYPTFFESVRSTGRRLIENPLLLDTAGYSVDVDGLNQICDERVRMLLLCNPHNPSGRVLRRDELDAIAAWVVERDVIVVSDEVHADLVYSGNTHIPFASLSDEIATRTITLTAASKAFNIAGLRAAVAVFGDADLKKRFCELPRHIRGGVGILGIESLRAAWLYGDPWLDQVVAYLEGNRNFVADFVRREMPEVGHHSPEATYLAWLDCRTLDLEHGPHRFFLEHGRVALSDGSAFGTVGRGFARVNFATSRDILCEVMQRMVSALNSRA